MKPNPQPLPYKEGEKTKASLRTSCRYANVGERNGSEVYLWFIYLKIAVKQVALGNAHRNPDMVGIAHPTNGHLIVTPA
jgi:hypothetical protein